MVHTYEFSEDLRKPLQVVCITYVHTYIRTVYTEDTEQTVLRIRMCGKLGIADVHLTIFT